jgi:hypothetical protein
LGVRRHVRAAEARSPAQFDGFESLDSRLARLRKPHSGSFAFLLSTRASGPFCSTPARWPTQPKLQSH